MNLIIKIKYIFFQNHYQINKCFEKLQSFVSNYEINVFLWKLPCRRGKGVELVAFYSHNPRLWFQLYVLLVFLVLMPTVYHCVKELHKLCFLCGQEAPNKRNNGSLTQFSFCGMNLANLANRAQMFIYQAPQTEMFSM